MTGSAFRTISALIALAWAGSQPLWAQDVDAVTPSQEKQAEPPPLPRFRHVDPGGKPVDFARDQVTILADDDFPPFSYAGPEGEAQGIAVEVAQAACQELRINCQMVLMPWRSLSGLRHYPNRRISGCTRRLECWR